MDRTVERGYAGQSLWNWEELPNTLSDRYKEYARANASIGINGTVLNNVNASPQILSTEYLQKVKALADISAHTDYVCTSPLICIPYGSRQSEHCRSS